MSLPPLTDAHVHFWDPARFRYPWLASVPALERAYLPVDYASAAATANVQKLIFVECGCEPGQSLEEVDWVCDLAKNEPRLKGIIACAALEKGESVRADLEVLVRRPLVKGVRRSLQDESDAEFCLRPPFVQGLELLAGFGLTFDVCVRSEQLPAIIALARRVPEVTIVLDHCGKPDIRHREYQYWARNLEALAVLPNVVCKLSGLTTEADWVNWKPHDLKRYLEQVFQSFGFDRVLFGSDWPVATLATTHPGWLEVVRESVSFATDAEQSKLFRDNADRVYRV